ncbi:MAG: biotin--[acetyl-CoA-carboxylase] ligase [Anaerovoracaceae bacterium]
MLKNKIIKQLEEHKGQPISGSALAAQLQVSRTAIWKVINNLKDEGYAIESVGKKGYVLNVTSDILSKAGIQAWLAKFAQLEADADAGARSSLEAALVDLPLQVYESVGSTNTVASSMALEGCENFTTVVANEQTKGKGRLGRSFYSPAQTGIYLSIVIKPNFNLSKALLITTAASVAVASAINEVSGADAKIKWVNDIFVNGKKVAGILTEALSDFESGSISNIILGIGINCHETNFPKELKEMAGSVGGGFDRNQLAAMVIRNVIEKIQNLNPENFIPEYKKRSLVLGQEIIVYKSGIKEEAYGVPATAIDITNQGGLKVQYKNGETHTLSTGEISISLK